MTIEDLARARAADDELRVLEMARRAAWDQATRTTRAIFAEPGRGSAEVHRFDSLADLDAEILRLMEQLNAHRTQILREIQALKNPTQRAILTAYYVAVRTPEGRKMTWEDIAAELCYSLRNVQLLRTKAIEALGVSGPNWTRKEKPCEK